MWQFIAGCKWSTRNGWHWWLLSDSPMTFLAPTSGHTLFTNLALKARKLLCDSPCHQNLSYGRIFRIHILIEWQGNFKKDFMQVSFPSTFAYYIVFGKYFIMVSVQATVSIFGCVVMAINYY